MKQAEVALNEAIAQILYVEALTFEQVRKIIASRTSLNANVDVLNAELNRLASLHDNLYYLKRESVHLCSNWRSSPILLQSEKQKIIDRAQQSAQQKEKEKAEENEEKAQQNNEPLTAEQELLLKYGAIVTQIDYNKYDRLYQDKYNRVETLQNSVNENKDYFKRMRKMIQDEGDEDKQAKMMEEFRTIFNNRKANIKQYKNEIVSISKELKVIKQRINAYVIEKQKSQNEKLK